MAPAEAALPGSPLPLPRALGALYARIPLGMKLGLEPMQAACAALGHPERAFDAVHIAGTNGKGSTAAMTEAIARALGLRTGLYTSPHLVRFGERIRIDGVPLEDAALASVLDEALVRAPELSFFETATLAAFVAFRAAKVDLAILEVGIGGRLDATNVIPPPRVAAVTSIGFDHTDRLGHTLTQIAREKAGILKAGVHAFHGDMPDEARCALLDVAREVGAEIAPAPARDVRPGLAGAHQISNARVAYALGRALGASDASSAEAIAAATWPGRLERIETERGPVLLDAAHNADGAAALARHLREHGPGASKTALVFGALADKDWCTSLDHLAPLADQRLYVRAVDEAPSFPRHVVAPEDFAGRHSGVVCASLGDALTRAAATGAALVVVTGSIYLVGHARSVLLGLAPDPPVAL